MTSVSNASTRAVLQFWRTKSNRRLQNGRRQISDWNQYLQDSYRRLSTDAMVEVWQRVERDTGDRVIGLKTARLVPFGWYGTLDYLLASSASFGDGLRDLITFFHLANGAANLRLYKTKQHVHVEYHDMNVPSEHVRRSIQYTFAIILLRFRFITAADWNPTEVHFAFDEKYGLDFYERFFNCRIRFNQPISRMILRQSLLSLPNAGADVTLHEFATDRAWHLLNLLPEEQLLVDRLRAIVSSQIGRTPVTLRAIAKELAMSQRNLQRRLKAEGTSFRQVLDDIRHRHVMGYLRHKNVPIRELTFLLGFSEPSAFHRAFKRWTGKTPHDFRRDLD